VAALAIYGKRDNGAVAALAFSDKKGDTEWQPLSYMPLNSGPLGSPLYFVIPY